MIWELSTTEWITSFGFVCCLTYITGWLADGIMKYSAFGHIGNWLLLLLGSYTAMYVFNMNGYKLHWNPLFTLVCVGGGAAGFFVIMCISKRILVK